MGGKPIIYLNDGGGITDDFSLVGMDRMGTVGMFMRISRGRTIINFIWDHLNSNSSAPFVSQYLVAPRLIAWLRQGFPGRATPKSDLATTFVYLLPYPILVCFSHSITNAFFITSSDSAALVIATCANSGEEPDTRSKIYWSVVISILAMIFLIEVDSTCTCKSLRFFPHAHLL